MRSVFFEPFDFLVKKAGLVTILWLIQKNNRCTVQYPAISAIIIDKGITIRLR